MSNKRKCLLCKTKNQEVDYKDVATLSRYMDRWNKIQPANRSYNCAKHQRLVQNAIKRARFLALMPFTVR
jgi:small subunit ribosomal protein S18